MHYVFAIAVLLSLTSLLCAFQSLRKRNAFGVALLCALTLFMLAGALPAPGGGQLVVFRTPVFVCLLCLLCAATAGCLVRTRRFHPGFVLCHLAVIVVLCGAFFGYLFGKRTQFAAPIAMEHGISRLPGPDDTSYELPFALSVNDFRVEWYAPQYYLYAPPEGGGDYQLERTVTVPEEGSLDLGGGDRVRREDLRTDQGGWVRQHVLPSDRLLQMGHAMPRHYEANLEIRPEDGPARTVTLAVNHPVSEAGWRFYLMSYDQEARRYIVMSARRDPGRGLVIAGLWLTIIGTAWLCWFPGKRRESQVPTQPEDVQQDDGDALESTAGGEA